MNGEINVNPSKLVKTSELIVMRYTIKQPMVNSFKVIRINTDQHRKAQCLLADTATTNSRQRLRVESFR